MDSRELNPQELYEGDLRGFMTHLAVLKEQGHLKNVTFGDDADSRRLVANVRRMLKVPARSLAAPRTEARERRPAGRRSTTRAAASRGDPHPGEPDPDPLASWGGVFAASVRMHAHVLRRTAAERAA